VDPSFAERYTAIAVTKQFEGSPHIDTENIAPFYGLALGDFTGGAICVETCSHEVAHVDTRRRLGKIDGRFPHWVAPHEGERCVTAGAPHGFVAADYFPEPSLNLP
jgi:hypothetical protein